MRRVRNHVALGAASVGAAWAVFAAIRSNDAVFRASMATAYVALGLFAHHAWLRPVSPRCEAVATRSAPTFGGISASGARWSRSCTSSWDCRCICAGRCGSTSCSPVKGALLPRIDPFGAANYTGLAATLILVALLVTSNDASLRRLGTRLGGDPCIALVAWALILTLLHARRLSVRREAPRGRLVVLASLSVRLPRCGCAAIGSAGFVELTEYAASSMTYEHAKKEERGGFRRPAH